MLNIYHWRRAPTIAVILPGFKLNSDFFFSRLYIKKSFKDVSGIN